MEGGDEQILQGAVCIGRTVSAMLHYTDNRQRNLIEWQTVWTVLSKGSRTTVYHSAYTDY